MRILDILTSEEKLISEKLMNMGPYMYTPIRYTNADRAYTIIGNAIAKLRSNFNTKIYIFFDIDFDGVASGYIMWTMLKVLGQCNPLNIIPIINRERKHGVNDDIIGIINNDPNAVLTIIVDSSTNLPDLFTKLNCDCVIIDHHDIEISAEQFNGRTQGGEYTIVNNNIDLIEGKSATEVVYEFWQNYSPDVLRDLQLEEWVAVSLYSDVIDTYTEQNLWFTSFLRNLRPTCDLMKIIEPLGLVEVLNGKTCLTRNSISFQLVPLINSCMRMQSGPEMVNTILYRPHILPDFKKCVIKQKEIVEALLKTAKIENYNDVILAQISNTRKKSNRPVFGMAQINAMKQDMVLAGLSESLLAGFNGLLATKISNTENSVTLVYSSIVEDGKTLYKGSIRTQGRYKNINLRAALMKKEGWTASGHGDAFGFSFDRAYGDAHKMAADVAATLLQHTLEAAHITRIPLADYNFFQSLANTMNDEAINDILRIAELNNLKTSSDRYYFEFTVGGGFNVPSAVKVSKSVTEYTILGAGPLKFKLTCYDDEEPKFLAGETYEVYLERTDGYVVHGNISKLTSSHNADVY